jgi:hypothetical protein
METRQSSTKNADNVITFHVGHDLRNLSFRRSFLLVISYQLDSEKKASPPNIADNCES